MSRHQKQGYVWFLPWWHVLIWPIKNFAFSFFYIKPATVSSRAFVLCRMAQNILGQKLKRFQLKSSNPFVYARPVPLTKYQHPVLPPGNGPMVREGLLCELTFKWYVTESDLCLPGFTPCGCEEEHPPLYQRRCLDLVLTSYNCQSLFHRAFPSLLTSLSLPLGCGLLLEWTAHSDFPAESLTVDLVELITRCQAEDVEATKALEAKQRAILSGLLSFETGTNLYTEAYGLPSLRASAQGHQQRGGQEIPGTFAASSAAPVRPPSSQEVLKAESAWLEWPCGQEEGRFESHWLTEVLLKDSSTAAPRRPNKPSLKRNSRKLLWASPPPPPRQTRLTAESVLPCDCRV